MQILRQVAVCFEIRIANFCNLRLHQTTLLVCVASCRLLGTWATLVLYLLTSDTSDSLTDVFFISQVTRIVTPYSYNLYLLSRLLLKLGVFGKSGIVERWRSSFFLKHKVEQTVTFLMFLGILLNNLAAFHLKLL